MAIKGNYCLDVLTPSIRLMHDDPQFDIVALNDLSLKN